MRLLGIDDHLADLNVPVNHVGSFVDLIGLCQGGMAGALIDMGAQQSRLSAMADATPLEVFRGLMNAGAGRVIGHHISKVWDIDSPDVNDIGRSLQTPEPIGSPKLARLEAIFNHWTFASLH